MNNYSPQAFFGGLLWGNSLMRFVYIDEAGTSSREPVTIVVGLIVDADRQVVQAEQAIEELLGDVPAKFKDGFYFHAADLWSNKKYHSEWSLTDRLGLMKRMMSLPRRLGISISMAMIRRSAEEEILLPNMSKAQWQHFKAFSFCVAHADKFIRDNAKPEEVAAIVAEDERDMREFLEIAAKIFRTTPIVLPPGSTIPTQDEIDQGYSTQEGVIKVSRIRRSPHFVGKSVDPILQMADACAYGLRRYFSDQKMGEDYVSAILGKLPHKPDFAGPMSVTTWKH